MNILMTGGTGFIGEALVPSLLRQGHRISVLTRQQREDRGDLRFLRNLDDCSDAFDAVINLAGASLAGRRWNASYKREIVNSRLDTTRSLGDYFRRTGHAPGVWLNASAVGFYGPHGSELLDENSPAGDSFSALLCRDWERAAQEAAPESTRLCLLRLGVVLDRDGGAYPQMAMPFRLGVANWTGEGHQYLAWIHRDDVVAAMEFLLVTPRCEGVFNFTAPVPVTSREFCAAMKKVHRTLLTLPMPAPVMRAMVGEMADELLLTGQRVRPARLEAEGFTFSCPDIDAALEAIERGA
jgi:uncharacterized protein (TIGR01777 family)